MFLPSVPNVAPSGITVSRYSSNTLKVTWNGLNLTQARGFIDSYKISYSTLSRRRSSTNGFITVPGDQTSASIPDVDSNKKYGVTVAAQTKKGTGPDSVKVSESGQHIIMLMYAHKCIIICQVVYACMYMCVCMVCMYVCMLYVCMHLCIHTYIHGRGCGSQPKRAIFGM